MFLCGWGGLGRSKVKNPFWQKSHTSAQSPQNPPFLEWLSKKERWSFSSVLSAVLPWFKDLQWYSKLVPSCMKKRWQFLYANYNDRQFISHLFFFSVTPCWCNGAQRGCRLLKTAADIKGCANTWPIRSVQCHKPHPQCSCTHGFHFWQSREFWGVKKGFLVPGEGFCHGTNQRNRCH